MHACGRKAKYVAVRPRAAMYGAVSRCTSTQDTADAIIICYWPYGCTRSQFLEAQVISSSVDGWTVARRPAWWGGWSSALITLSSGVFPLSLTTHTFLLSLPMLCLYTGMIPVRRWRQPFIYASEQVCIGWHRTGACYTDKLTFFHGSSIKV